MNLRAFDVDPQRGFLPAEDPIASLPAAYAAWEDVARDLPKLLAAGAARRTLARLAPLALDALHADGERRRAMLLLSYFGHAYVWGEHPPAASLPPGIAVPWHAVAERLGRPPVLSYASYALDNWRRLDLHGPIALGNIALRQNFLGGVDEEWFVLVHVEIEAKAGTAMRAAAGAVESGDDVEALRGHLERLAPVIEDMHATLQRMPEGCDPYIYFNRVRPYIHGWRDNPALGEGVVYEGVEAYGGRPQRFRGETGAQSSIVPALDATLGVRHQEDVLTHYLREMRDYMPPRHRAFVHALETRSRVRETAAAAGSGVLREAYNACLAGLAAFRSTHLEYAGRYIHAQSEATRANPGGVGTGGTPFMAYLTKHREETLEHLLPA